ncbi:glutamate--cysteine ligase [Microbacterium esteraromaticum]|uniref:Putative glutamate--cysteine ligase 2 n=1 Tax=Microbacterium esteraromaticum TaxID=57043 RepID=A0A7D8AKY3_9MICO|nr:glutamate--cysteine ligase [Microbacterium esteraromaticum]QMU98069.1 glutamate--cysteine ligase [Microbacterium esteraromaticum]
MPIEFASSARSTVGLEWEIMLADPTTGDLVGRAPELLTRLEEQSASERHTVTGELLTNTIEVTSGVGATVSAAIDDIAAAIASVRRSTDSAGIELLSAGSHPFAQWYDQRVTDKNRYHKLIERTQWWGRNMMIWGIHVHVGVDDRTKVLPIVGALSAFLPHLQALSASSPYWAGERTGYASNRALVFQQLPTAGLPWPMSTWSEFETFVDDMTRTGVMDDPSEIRWDIRPAPRWGTIEVRACDGMSTLTELASIAALTQTLVEFFSRELDDGRQLPTLQPWFHRENKWRAARYGLDARVIVDRAGSQIPVREHIAAVVEDLMPVAADLHCTSELQGVLAIIEQGASYSRQLAAADASGGDLRQVVQHLIREFRAGPEHSIGV